MMGVIYGISRNYSHFLEPTVKGNAIDITKFQYLYSDSVLADAFAELELLDCKNDGAKRDVLGQIANCCNHIAQCHTAIVGPVDHPAPNVIKWRAHRAEAENAKHLRKLKKMCISGDDFDTISSDLQQNVDDRMHNIHLGNDTTGGGK